MKARGGAGTAASLIVACVFGVAMLLSLTTGAGVYRQVQQRVESSASERLGITYITAKIHASDADGAVRTGDFGGEDAVFLEERIDGIAFETVIYVHDGWLMELFAGKDSGMGPDDGQQLIPAEGLEISQSGRLLRLEYTDENGRSETAYVFLRSGG